MPCQQCSDPAGAPCVGAKARREPESGFAEDLGKAWPCPTARLHHLWWASRLMGTPLQAMKKIAKAPTPSEAVKETTKAPTPSRSRFGNNLSALRLHGQFGNAFQKPLAWSDRLLLLFFRSSVQNLHERSPAQILNGQPGRGGLLFGEGPAVDAAQEEIQ